MNIIVKELLAEGYYKTYPYVAQYTTNKQLVVVFTSQEAGFVLSSAEIGAYHYTKFHKFLNWEEKDFLRIKSITLTIEN